MKEAAIVKEAARRAVREARVQSLQVRRSLPPLARRSISDACSCLWGKMPHACCGWLEQTGMHIGVVL